MLPDEVRLELNATGLWLIHKVETSIADENMKARSKILLLSSLSVTNNMLVAQATQQTLTSLSGSRYGSSGLSVGQLKSTANADL